ncbi:MAG: hydroxymethylglutaryl-CoA lyase [Gammaproteobacteria bacterium]|nr:hydroxymethylglutaryl-CoA lyase [Gammaproteobacteria bacterium]
MADLPGTVRIVEVGPRDGLQNEQKPVHTDVKIEFIERLSAAGLTTIETTSFVRPDWIPQLADAEAVMRGLRRRRGVSYPVLVPNEKGMQRALAAEADEVAVFTAASETFNQKNTNAGIDESLNRFQSIATLAKEHGVRMRGYISCVLGCPYEGDVAVAKVTDVAGKLDALGCYEISLGDTIGAGTPGAARTMLETVAHRVPMERLAVHFHDTRGQALANIYACLQAGVSVVDASVSGLGGCPYAGGATGNVATEDLVYMLEGLGIETGVSLPDLLDAGAFISEALERQPASKLGRIPRK